MSVCSTNSRRPAVEEDIGCGIDEHVVSQTNPILPVVSGVVPVNQGATSATRNTSIRSNVRGVVARTTNE